jgi:hypothetical protein
MIEDYPYAGIDFSRDPEMPVPPSEERGEIGKSPPILFFVCICNFYVFFGYISCFLDNRVLMGELLVVLQMLDLCGLPTLRGTGAVPDQRPQLSPPRGATAGNPTPAEAERALVRIERNFTELTRTVPMIDIEDMPPSLCRLIWWDYLGVGSDYLGIWVELYMIITGPTSPEPTCRLLSASSTHMYYIF